MKEDIVKLVDISKMDERLLKKHIMPFLEKGYHKEMGISQQKFIENIPKVPERKGEYKPLLIIPDKLINFGKQIELTRLKINVNYKKIKNVSMYEDKPYWILFQDGLKNKGRSPENCRINLKESERGVMAIEGVSIYLQYPESVKNHSIDLIGSTYGNECTPTIYYWDGKIMMSAICSDVADQMCGAATCLTNLDPISR